MRSRQLINRGTMVPVKCAPQNERILPSILNMTEKFGPNGEFIKNEGEICVPLGIMLIDPLTNHCEEVTSRTMNYESLMTLLSAGAYHNAILGTFDFPGAFLNAKLRKNHYMRLTPEVTDNFDSGVP